MTKLPQGLIKMKGDCPCIAPHRFFQFPKRAVIFHTLLKMDMLGYVIYDGRYWVLCREGDGSYIRVPFARNETWFLALISEPEFEAIGKLPQIFVTGVA